MREILHSIIIVVSAIAIILWVHFGKKHRPNAFLSFAPIIYLLHIMLFSISALFFDLSPITLNLWSLSIRLHSLFTLLGVGIAVYSYE
jgi:hypothetical protein